MRSPATITRTSKKSTSVSLAEATLAGETGEIGDRTGSETSETVPGLAGETRETVPGLADEAHDRPSRRLSGMGRDQPPR